MAGKNFNESTCEIRICHVVRRLDDASDHILSFLDARETLVTGTTSTYKQLRETLDVVVGCGYFTRPVCTDDAHHDSDDDAVETNVCDLHSMYESMTVCMLYTHTPI